LVNYLESYVLKYLLVFRQDIFFQVLFLDINKDNQQRIDALKADVQKFENRIKMIYIDKLDGKISEDFWIKQHNDFNTRLIQTEELIIKHHKAIKTHIETADAWLELANNASSKYFLLSYQDRALLLKNYCQNFCKETVKLS